MLEDTIDFFIAGTIGLFSWFLGDNDGYIRVLITLMIVDFVMGIIVAYSKHQLSSSIGFIGISKKMFIICLVGVAHVIDVHIVGESAFRAPVALFYIANEGLSIIENADALNIPIPKFLRDRFLSMRKKK